MTDFSTLSFFNYGSVLADAGGARLGWTGMHLRWAEIVAGAKEASKQGRDVNLDGWTLHVYMGRSGPLGLLLLNVMFT